MEDENENRFNMPFKIVQTIEEGKPKLCIVPSSWEKKDLLRWPPKKYLNKYIRDDKSHPLPDWTTMKCTTKRTFLPTYRRAEEEINLMIHNSDTDYNEMEKKRNGDEVHNKIVDFNDVAADLVLQSHNIPETSTSTGFNAEPSADLIEIIGDGKIIATAVNLEQENVDKLLTNQKNLLDNQVTIMQNQSLLHETQQTILEQEKKNFRQLQNLSVQLDYCFARFNPQNSDNVVPLGQSTTTENNSFLLKPLSNIQELQDFDTKLADNIQNKELREQYSFLCSIREGSGSKCAYKLLDILFSKEFLCQFSWSGGSRSSTVKIALKGYKRVLHFFFQLLHYWDPLYTQTDMEVFFKTVLKNSTKRLQTKGVRTATKRNRQKKENNNKRQKTTTETVESEEVNENNESEGVPDELNADNNQEIEPNHDETKEDRDIDNINNNISTETENKTNKETTV